MSGTAQAAPNTLTIAGMDPSGGAGILADVKTMSALGSYACAVVAALTAQNTQTVSDILPVNPQFVRQQIDTLFADVDIHAVKVGMLGQVGVIETVAERLAHFLPRHVVLDPVMVSKSGDLLLEQKAVGVLRESTSGVAIYVAPSRSLIDQVIEEAKARFDKRLPDEMTIVGKLTNEYRIDVTNSQILGAVPECERRARERESAEKRGGAAASNAPPSPPPPSPTSPSSWVPCPPPGGPASLRHAASPTVLPPGTRLREAVSR